jgi:hypothetical protein
MPGGSTQRAETAMFKMYQIEDGIVQIDAKGKLDEQDYKSLRPQLEEALAGPGQVSMLFRLIDFEGWTFKALAEDLKLDTKYASKINKLAVVGEKTWHAVMSRLTDLFTGVDVRYFGEDEQAEARAWLTA